MTDRKYSNEDGLQFIAREGIGYAIQDYASAELFEDPETQKLWKAAEDALDAVVEHLESSTGTLLEDWEI